MLSEPVQLRILLEIAFDIVQDTRNIREKIRIAFDSIDIYKSSRSLEVALDAREVEQAAEGFPVGPQLPMYRQSINITSDQAVDQRLIEFDIGITQQRGEIVRRRSHQGVLKIDDP